MSNKILVTDSLFIKEKHVKVLENAGYEVERLDKPNASEEELCQAVKGKIGYLLGGTERISKKVIDSADALRAISLLGVGYEWFIPAYEHALHKGIQISNTPGGPSQEVAEWALTASLVMNREFFTLGRPAKGKKFAVTKGIEAQTVGILGMGSIGTRIAEMVQAFNPGSIVYSSRHRDSEKESNLKLRYLDLMELLKKSDIVFLCVSDVAKNLLAKQELSGLKDGALLVNITHPGIIDEEALLDELESGRIRAVSDYPMSPKGFDELPLSTWFCMNTSNTVTEAGVDLMSNMAVQSMINLLTQGDDEYKIK